MLLQPGQGMGLLGAYNTGYTPINPQMNHYNSLLGRISGMNFTQPSGAMGPVANYFDGNTLMSGATGQPVYNLPAGAGQQYGTTQSYMDTLGRMPTSSNEIVSPYIYYRPQTDLSKIQQALEDQKATPEEVAQTVMPRGGGRNDYVDPYATSKATAQNRRNDGGQGDKLRDSFNNREGTGGYSSMGSGMAGGTQSGNGLA